MNRSQLGVFMIQPTRRTFVGGVICGLTAGGLHPLSAQITTSLRGTVSDSSGGVVANATVRIKNKETGTIRETKTGSSGEYFVSGLMVGTYDLEVATAGFATARQGDIQVGFGQSTTANITLEIGSMPETSARITSRAFLVGDKNEETGYGLYSYILFGRPPADSARERYLTLMREYLRLTEASTLRKILQQRQNITYLPVKASVPNPTAETVLASYNTGRATELLAHVPGGPHVDGPYIVSWQSPLSKAVVLPPNGYLFQDLSPVPAEVINIWVHEFLIQASSRDYWKKRRGPDAALKLRTAIAQLAVGVDPAKKALKDWQSLLASLINWNPGSGAK